LAGPEGIKRLSKTFLPQRETNGLSLPVFEKPAASFLPSALLDFRARRGEGPENRRVMQSGHEQREQELTAFLT